MRQRGAGADAEDLLQETFLRAYANLHRYRRRYRAAAWLFTIARRLSINHYHRTMVHCRLRRPAAWPAVDSADDWRSNEHSPDELVAAAEDREHLWQLVARLLSEEEMTALWLYYVEELSAREVGVVLQRSWLATKSLLSRARKKLTPQLTRFYNRPQHSSAANRFTSTEPARIR